MTPRPLNPRKAWIIGYRMSYEDWCQWSPTLPIPEACRPPPTEDVNVKRRNTFYWQYYTEWKNKLTRADQKKLPKVRYERVDDTILSAFIPFRWFEYTSQEDADPNDSDYDASVFQERETDVAQLQNLLKFLEEQGAPVDKYKISFGCMVDIHPRDDWRAH
ncbi:hypothetical protein AGABI1DRAFT_107959 [Agaricus bisporus var. burnettii JB137-S8]|uniref:Uncharacterized protein n=1 Tax=Agaricus bisporus var. burnettii (strain JB137-S8 / ATCC MYA-4627 / FGSC 10392) TaxID=597362 RepID=K5X4F1_AGABU|nr:uncharacterized protein AGABI1DRAFT_107959 [Agaricus bisporus var. burnettii JB137-S8]EKM77812.1 hypothetical protein AGABI1DRAFT_107959 [Agaricus bisporus var. burnettii JB137-S8]